MDSDSILTFEETQTEDKAFGGWISALRSQEANSTIELAGQAFDSMLNTLEVMGKLGWKLTKDTSTNVWKISEPTVKPAATSAYKTVKNKAIEGWSMVQDKSKDAWSIVAPKV